MNNVYELAIIGAGPAGLTASIYASRFKIKHLVLGRIIGGTANDAHQVENWPGEKSILGRDLVKKFIEQVENLGAQIEQAEIIDIEKATDGFMLTKAEGTKIIAQKILFAFGAERRKLNLPGEKELLGRGVSYCSTCDGALFRDKIVAVIGGGNAGATAALALADQATKVYLIFPEDDLIAEAAWAEKVKANRKIVIGAKNLAKEIKGRERVESIVLETPVEGQTEIKLDGVFIEAGSVPMADLAKKVGVELDEDGFIKIQPSGATNIAGIWAAGDITNGSDKFCQILTAAAEGAIAVNSIYRTLK